MWTTTWKFTQGGSCYFCSSWYRVPENHPQLYFFNGSLPLPRVKVHWQTSLLPSPKVWQQRLQVYQSLASQGSVQESFWPLETVWAAGWEHSTSGTTRPCSGNRISSHIYVNSSAFSAPSSTGPYHQNNTSFFWIEPSEFLGAYWMRKVLQIIDETVTIKRAQLRLLVSGQMLLFLVLSELQVWFLLRKPVLKCKHKTVLAAGTVAAANWEYSTTSSTHSY